MPFDRGWYRDDGIHVDSVHTAYAGAETNRFFNVFFAFDLSAVGGNVVSGTLELELEAYFGTDDLALAVRRRD